MKTTYTTPAGDLYNPFLDTLRHPHVMIGGTTGSGKSVLENGLIWTALHRFPDDAPGGAQFIFIDNGKGTEMIDYKDLPHTIRYAYEMEDCIQALELGLSIAKQRFEGMRKAHLKNYTGGDVYIFIDEFASLILNGRKRVSAVVQDLAQLGRAAKVHIILCTQCPIAKVIPTEIKVNFDCVWALRTKSAQDSRNLMGRRGCEDLPDHGQAYYITPKEETLYNVPNCTDEDISAIVEHWTSQQRPRKRPRLGFLGRLVAMFTA